MSFDTPEELYYADTHEWFRVEDGVGTVGITDFAQDELGDVIFVEFVAEEGDAIGQGDEFGTIESMKADAGLYAPVSGTITAINEELTDFPQYVNEDPYGTGWMVEIEFDDDAELDALLSAEGYTDQTA